MGSVLSQLKQIGQAVSERCLIILYKLPFLIGFWHISHTRSILLL